jgi:hypothetical protein
VDRREALTGQDEPILARWSRRKQEAREQAQADPAAEPVAEVTPDAGPAAASSDGAFEQEPAPRVLTDEDMPPIESLSDDADYSGFLSAGVSEVLRRQALRRLFSSPKFNVTDGLDDFAEDYTQFAPLGDVVTADMKHRMERLLDKLGSADAQDGEARAAVEPGDRDAAAPVGGTAQLASGDAAVADRGAEDPEPQRREGAEQQT